MWRFPSISTGFLRPVVLSLGVIACTLTTGINAVADSSCKGDSCYQSCTESPVLVIGAGMSGIAAAHELNRRGCKVTVLEARDRTGGRTYTHPKYAVEYGAGWIHGWIDNPLTFLAKKLGVPVEYVGGDSSYIGPYDQIRMMDQDGSMVSQKEFDEFFPIFENIIQNELEEFKNSWVANDYKDTCLRLAFENSPTVKSLTGRQKRLMMWHLESVYDLDWAADPSQLSLRNFPYDFYYHGESEDAVVPQGFYHIHKLLAEGIDIRLNTVVTDVTYDSTGVTVTTRDGTTFSGSAAVVTVPLGVLKAGDVEFNPPLPHKKQEALHNLDMGTLNKFFMIFDKPYWNTTQYVYQYLSDNQGEFPYFVNHMVEKRPGGYPILGFIYGGDEVHRFSQISEDEIVQMSLKHVSKVLGVELPQPLDIVFKRWDNDPFSHGGYSHVKPYAVPEFMDYLAAPLGNTMFFAGEHTVKQVAGTVNAAYTSGVRAADQITSLRKNVDAGVRQDHFLDWAFDPVHPEGKPVFWLPATPLPPAQHHTASQAYLAAKSCGNAASASPCLSFN